MHNVKGVFYYFGRFIYSARWLIIILFFLVFALCIPLLPKIASQFTDTGLMDPESQSAKTDTFLNDNLNYFNNRFIVVYQGKISFNNETFIKEIRNSLSDLSEFPLRHKIIYPNGNNNQVSKDKRSAYAVILVKTNRKLSDQLLNQFKSLIKKPPHLTVLIGGEPIFQADIQTQTQRDLIRAEFIATPIAMITLLLVFGSLTAAFVPIILDAICALFILSTLYFLGQEVTLSIFTINIALLLGLCLSLDYALFIIGRFREELEAGHPVVEALAITQATAGKAIFFSGLAVLISLTALFLFPINILFSVGVGGVTAVAFAVLVSIVLLPAILAVLRKKINYLSIRFFRRKDDSEGYWLWSLGKIIRHPWVFFIFCMMILGILSGPILNIKLGLSDFRILPRSLESRQVFDVLKEEFNENTVSPIIVVLERKSNGDFLTRKNIDSLYAFTKKLKKELPNIDEIKSIVNTTPQLSMMQYQQLYTAPKEYRDSSVKDLLLFTTDQNFSVMTVISKYPGISSQSQEVVNSIRVTKPPSGLTVKVTGETANIIDVMDKIHKVFPYALLWVIALTYLILLILLRSLLLPLKAIVMNILSLLASYGVLVYIFQEGYFAYLLNFDPQGLIDINLIVIIFCGLFGFSMDYEVFLLTRIKEFYEQTLNTNYSIRHGIAHSSKIITSAALVVILICFAFISADILMVKAFGLGIAVAIFVDAFLIRTILVPATMALMQKWCWYLPKWLNAILPPLSFNPTDVRHHHPGMKH